MFIAARQQRKLRIGTSLAVVVVLASGLAALAIRAGQEPPRRVLASGTAPVAPEAASTTSPSSTTAVPLTTPPTTSTTSTTAKPVLRPRPTTTRTAATTAPSGPKQPAHEDYGPRLPAPDSISYPYSPGQSQWAYDSGGLHMVLTVSPAQPQPGQTVHFMLQATDDAASCCGFVLAFGDGQEFEYQNGRSCPKEDLKPGAFSTETDHVYATGSPKEFMFTALTESCTAPNAERTMYGFVDVQN